VSIERTPHGRQCAPEAARPRARTAARAQGAATLPGRRTLLLTTVAALVGALSGCSKPGADAAAPPAGGDFVLQTDAGPFELKSARGQVVLMYFGYTNCPDHCPVTPTIGVQALRLLEPAARARVRLLMVSVDPARDTPQKMKDYVAMFHPQMLGLTGTPAEVDNIGRQYGAPIQRQPPQADGSYAVDHSAQTYLIGPDGRLKSVIAFDATAQVVADAIGAQL